MNSWDNRNVSKVTTMTSNPKQYDCILMEDPDKHRQQSIPYGRRSSARAALTTEAQEDAAIAFLESEIQQINDSADNADTAPTTLLNGKVHPLV